MKVRLLRNWFRYKTGDVVEVSDHIAPAMAAQGWAEMATANACPDCGGRIEMAEGCKLCRNCGWGKCG